MKPIPIERKEAILAKRKDLYEAKRSEKPDRWIRNKTRNWEPVRSKILNPINPQRTRKNTQENSMIFRTTTLTVTG